MQNKNKELDRLNGVYMKLLNNAGVNYIEGRGKLVDAHTVEVNGKHYTVSLSRLGLLALCSRTGFAQSDILPLWANRVADLLHACLNMTDPASVVQVCRSAVLYMPLGLLEKCCGNILG